MTVNIAGTFKKDERDLNGLEHIAEELIDKPLQRHVVVGMIETKRISTDISDGGTKTVVVRFLQLEPIVDSSQAERARTMLAEAYETRTGRDHDPDETLFDGEQEPGQETAE